MKAGVADEEVDKAALAGVHGGEAEGLAGAGDFVNGLLGGPLELLVAARFVAGGVEAERMVLLGGEAEELCGEVLEGVEEFGAAVEEQGNVGAGEVDAEHGIGTIGRGGRFGLEMEFKGHSCSLDVTTQKFFDGING